jgi:uncharacterized protein (TIGR02266 family)
MSDAPPDRRSNPPADEHREQRGNQRITATFKVKYEGFAEFLTEYTDDLSRGGMFLVTRNFLPINSIIRCELFLPGTEDRVRIIARVAHVLTEGEAQRVGRKPGMGVEFLDLPREDADRLLGYVQRMATVAARESRMPGARPTQPPASTYLRSKRTAEILVVDDQPAYLEEVALALGKAGFVVRKAQNGLVGLAECLKKPPDLILADVQMPQMDGWALLRMARARPTLAQIPFVFLTALSGESERLRGYKMGVDDYITKPHDLDALAGRLDRILARYERAPGGAMNTKTLSGDLDQVSLASLLGHLDEEKKSGVLLVVREHEQATLFIAGGRVVKCDLPRDDLEGPDKVLWVLGWTQGRFEFAPQDVPSADEIRMPVSALLAEYKRRSTIPPRTA